MSISSVGSFGAQTPLPASSQGAAPQSASASPGAQVQAASTPPAPTREQVNQALKEVQHAMGSVASDLQFTIDSDSGKTVVKVMDAQTKEVIRQIPSEEMLTIAKSLDMMQGLLLRQKA